MTKQHFIALADTMRNERPTMNPDEVGRFINPSVYQFALSTYYQTLTTLADFCQQQNPRFNRSRWLDYIEGKCGPNGGAVKTNKEAA